MMAFTEGLRQIMLFLGIVVAWAILPNLAPAFSESGPMSVGSFVMPAVPSFESIPSTPEGEQIRLGYNLVVNTQTYAKAFVGNGLSCSNCHLEAGRKIGAGTYVGVSLSYPRYRARAGRQISLQERINECFERSMNGHALPEDSPEMV